MRLALLGADDETLELVRRAVLMDGHGLTAAYDVGPRADEVQMLEPRVWIGEDWESLLLGTIADAVIVARGRAGLARATGISDDERRDEQLRKLAQAAVPMLVMHPACEAIVGFEIEMIRRDSGGSIVPYVAGANHPALLRLQELVLAGESSPVGAVEQILFEREQAERSRSAVLVRFARDVALLRRLTGTVVSLSATGPAPTPGRDPLGPKPKELPALSNLSVHVSGAAGRTARWSLGPALEQELGRITLLGERGKVVLEMPADGPWRLEIRGQAAEAFPHHNDLQVPLWQLSPANRRLRAESDAWLAACRDQEAAEAIDRSLARGRTIELFNEEHTEEESFKGIMAMGGCLLLVTALAVVFLATIVEGLRLPIRDWAVWKFWPIYLLVPIAAFLLLQLLQLVVKKETPDVRQLLGPEQEGR